MTHQFYVHVLLPLVKAKSFFFQMVKMKNRFAKARHTWECKPKSDHGRISLILIPWITYRCRTFLNSTDVSALGAGSLSHWTPRAVPSHYPVFPFAFFPYEDSSLHTISTASCIEGQNSPTFIKAASFLFPYRTKAVCNLKSIALVLLSLHQREMWTS